jgi:ribosomal protein L3
MVAFLAIRRGVGNEYLRTTPCCEQVSDPDTSTPQRPFAGARGTTRACKQGARLVRFRAGRKAILVADATGCFSFRTGHDKKQRL